MKTAMTSNALRLAAALSLAASACASTSAPRRVEVAYAPIAMSFAGADDADPEVNETCERAVRTSLARHGFTEAPGATHLAVRVSLADDGTYYFGNGMGVVGAPSPSAFGSGTSASAEFTATWFDASDGRPFSAAATGSAGAVSSGLMRPAGRARLAACVYGAELLVEALLERTAAHSR
jgi:hypothetical protein